MTVAGTSLDAPSRDRASASTQAMPVVYVAGSGHTGSTLLALVLNSHPDIACIGESAIKPKIIRRGVSADQACSCGATIGNCPFWLAVFAGVQRDGLDFGPDRWTNDYRFHNVYAQKLLKRLCATPSGRGVVQWAADHLPGYQGVARAKDAVNVALIRAVLHVAGARVFADTSKGMPRLTHLLRLPQLEIRLVQLSRDVRGYAASAKGRDVSAADAARTWLRDQKAIVQVAAGMPPDRVFHLRYEDLSGRVADTQRALWSFIGVPDVAPVERIRATDHHVLGNAMRLGGEITLRLDERWRARLTAGEQRECLTIAGDMNRALGYET
jgi:hypothetical protein